MVDDLFPGQDDFGREPTPGRAFFGEFADEPPLVDMVPRAVAVYERGRRRRQAAGVGGAVAAVAATALVATQLGGGGGTGVNASPGRAGTPTAAVRSSPLRPPVTSSPAPTMSMSSSSPSGETSGKPSGGPCDRTFTLAEKMATSELPIPSQAAARKLCEQGLTAFAAMLPGHAWAPVKDPFVAPGEAVTYLADDYASDAAPASPLGTGISTKPYFTAHCANVWYPQTQCQSVTLAEGMTGIVFGGAPVDGKPGGYELDVDLSGGRQFQFSFGFEKGAPEPMTLDGFLALVRSEHFAEYLKQYAAAFGS
ncbi:hypothetical protein ABIA31_005708 [Catenulispora sp. MAP5-51]|uniref:hypothetical protein n=1 Tax=Catenulispora sp. MAP5-51 TaxID=3156298 RepID=UPI003517A251